MTNGKGHLPRPLSVDEKTYRNNWERTFGNFTDYCEYSGLPNVTSYEFQETIHAPERN